MIILSYIKIITSYANKLHGVMNKKPKEDKWMD